MDNSQAIFHQSLAVVPYALSEFAIGIGCGWVAPTIGKLLDNTTSEITPTATECSWIASLSEFGRTCGPLFSIFLLDTLGRKLMMQIGAVTFLLVWLAVLFTRSVLILCVARFAFGLSVGMCNVTSSIYFGENCSPKIRGIFCSICITCYFLGMLVEYILATYFSYNTTALVSLTITTVCLFSTLLLIETPQFLILKGRHGKAEKNLTWLRGTSDKADISSEFQSIKSNIASEKTKKTSYKKLLTAPANYRSLITMLTLNVLISGTGNVAICNYSSVIFPATKFFTSYEFTIFYGIIQLFFALSSSLVIEKYNRRTLTLLSFSAYVICHSTIALLYYSNDSIVTAGYSPWIIFFLVCTYASFSTIMSSVGHMLRGELFPQSIKPFGSGLSITALSFTGFITIRIFLLIKDKYGIYMNFVLYLFVSITALLFSYFKLPETRGKTLIEIQKSLE